MRPLIRRLKTFTTAKTAMWIGMPVSVGCGLLFYFGALQSIESDSRARFANHARTAQNTITARIKSYTDVLRGAASMFQANPALTRDQFRDYVTGLSLPQYFPAIEVINYAEYLTDDQRPAFERRMRAEVLPAEWGVTPFHISPPGRRAEYSVLTFVEPPMPWSSTIGLDLQARKRVEAAIAASRDAGSLITSGEPIAAISGPNRTGLGMRLPIYRAGMPLNTVGERRAAFIGSIGIAFSVHKLVKGVLDEMPIKSARMTLVDSGLLYANSQFAARNRTLFDSSGSERQPAPPLQADAAGFSETLPVDYNGRLWKATFSVPKADMYTRFDELVPWMAMATGFLSSMLIYALLHTLTSSRLRAVKLARGMTKELRDSQSKLQQSHENLRRLAAHAEHIKEGERKRIAREIHDDLGQNMLALRIEVDMLALRTRHSHPRLHARARSMLAQIDTTIKSVRQIINDLRPNVLDLGLSAAVEWQVAEFVRRNGISCEVSDDHHEIRLNDNCATAFFRILQESLSNIVRHAKASAVRVELQLHDGNLWMTIADNGVGLLPHVRYKAGSFGLVGIEERIIILGGSFSITSTPGYGTTVRVSAPVREDLAPPSPPAPPAPPVSPVPVSAETMLIVV